MNDNLIKVLLIEDNPGDARLVREMLAGVGTVHFELVHVECLGKALESLAERSFDVILLDLSLPDGHGLDTVVRVRAATSVVPIVVMSGHGDEELAIGAVHEGAQDYLVKGRVDKDLLVRSIRYAIERERVERALRESERRYRALFETALDAIMVVDGDGRHVDANPQATTLTGYSRPELIGMSAIDIIPVEHRDAVGELHKALDRLGTLQGEYRLQRKDGRVIDVEFSAAKAGDGCYHVALCDVTERKRVEQFRNEYIHTISHDLRNPLAIIQGQAQIVQRFADRADQVRKSANSIITSTQRMNAMIEDLVESARLEAGQVRLEKQPISMGRFLSGLLERAIGAMDVGRVKVEIPADLSAVNADPDRLERILMNLLTNALKYSAPGTEVLIRAEATDLGMTVSMADHGVGIAADELPHIFARFYRAGTAPTNEGLGMGLYITGMLIEAHGGRVWAESELGKGSTFYFSLPLS